MSTTSIHDGKPGGGGGCHHLLKAKTREEFMELSFSMIRDVTSTPLRLASIQVSCKYWCSIGEADT